MLTLGQIISGVPLLEFLSELRTRSRESSVENLNPLTMDSISEKKVMWSSE